MKIPKLHPQIFTQMTRFTIRIELHKAEPIDYTALHKAMEGAGFLRTIQSREGKIYELPKAEYSLIGNYTLDQAFAKAKITATTTGDAFSMLVTEVAGYRKFFNLDKAEE